MVLLTSGKGGVGTTTIAVNLAVALSRLTHRVLLVDADPRGGDAALMCGVHDGHTLADVLTVRRAVSEVICPGPGQIELLPGVRGLERLGDCSNVALQRLIAEIEQLGHRFDIVLVESGNGLNRMVEQFWRSADVAMVVTTPDTASIMNTYALVKLLATEGPTVPIHCLVNQVEAGDSGEDVQKRLGQACRRFLGIRSQEAGHLPLDSQVRNAAQLVQPFMIVAPHCDAALGMERVAERLAAWLASRRVPQQRRRSA
jgi:flagellar biosynthesis protein FlhG